MFAKLLRILVVIAASVPVYGQAPLDRPATVSLSFGSMVTISDAGSDITPTAYIDVEAPLIVKTKPVIRVYSNIGITSLPGTSVDISDVETFKGAEVSLGLVKPIGYTELGKQALMTGIVAEWGFATRMATQDYIPENRLVRHYGIGLRFHEYNSGNSITFIYGRDQAAGDVGYGQWQVYGNLVIPRTSGVVSLALDAVLSAGKRDESLSQRDIFRIAVIIDPIEIFN